MKALYLTFSVLFFSSLTVFSQITPQTPIPPISKTTSSTGETTSVSISNGDDFYRLRARFSKTKNKELENVLKKEMGTKNLVVSRDQLKWKLNSNDNNVYLITLKPGRLNVSVDKEIADVTLVKKIKNISDLVKNTLYGGDYVNDDRRRKAERLQLEAERMQRDAERMLREADRLKINYKTEAKRISEKANKIIEEAEDLEINAIHNGSIKTTIKKILRTDATIFDEQNSGSFNNWVLPSFLKEFINQLKKDKLISSVNDIQFINDFSGMYVDGRKLNSSLKRKYVKVFEKHSVNITGFSFYKKGNHLFVLDGDPKLNTLLKAFKRKRLIMSLSTKTILEINGNSIFKDGISLSLKDVKSYNKMLTNHHIVPAPGKIIMIKEDGSSMIGYPLDLINEKGFIGTTLLKR